MRENRAKRHFKNMSEEDFKKISTAREGVIKDVRKWQEIADKKLVEHLSVFNDAIIAIIATIMVLEIPLPGVGVTYIDFIRSIVIFFISFFIVIHFWYKNHQISSILENVDRPYLILNFVFIALIALVPVMTKWMMLNHNSFAIANTGIVYLLANIIHLIMSGDAYAGGLKNSEWTRAFYHRLLKLRFISMFILNIVLIILAFTFPTYAMIAYLAMPILSFLTPNKV